MLKRLFLTTISCLLVFIFFSDVNAQPPTWTLNLIDSSKRSNQFVERKLGSEKMAEKKFNLYRRVVQNNFTHYNYYFNANNKINSVIERAKAAQKDDFTKLIGYYPYSFENTASQKTELDSVIYKATAGILLHDLRNAWIDDMYLLMGKAYFLRKDFDTAAATFQFINYNLFPRKKDEDGDRVVGTTEDASSSRISIANKEKQNILQKLTAKPPSRNDALVWLARTLTEQDELGEAAGLIHTLQNDPNLPKRLVDDLNDLNGYWFYKQGIYDSAAAYLEKGLSTAVTKQDKARSEFLLAQLYELTGNFDKASEYYNIASAHTTEALLDIYAQMNNAKMRKGNNGKELDNGIANLLKLTKKDKFEMYRDILYFSAGDLAMQKPDTNQAVPFYTKSLTYNETNIVYKNKAFLQLADIAYSRKQYQESFRLYDSLQSGDTTLLETLEKIQDRRNALSKIVEKIIIIEREDSLQRVAAMEPLAREAFVKKISRRLRKAQGLKEEDNNSTGTGDMISFDRDKDKPADLFTGSGSKGEWYFYNASVKSKGFNDFKRKWGTRTNTDNWRRKGAAAEAQSKLQDNQDNIGLVTSMNPDEDPQPVLDKDAKKSTDKKDAFKNLKGAGDTEQPEDLSYEGLMSNLPLTPEKLTESNNLLAVSLFELGKLFQQELEDYQEAINTYDQSLTRYPDSVYGGEIYLNLAYCYSKLGNTQQADRYKNIVSQQFGNSKAAKMLTDINAPKKGEKNEAGTKRYEDIYTLFIEGKFEEALNEKTKADSLYGKNYWTPQLLYIESVYHVKQKNDSAAINVLNNIVTLYPTSPLKPKAVRMIDVLGRRAEIEKYLTELKITRMTEDSVIQTNDRVVMIRNDSALIISPNLYDSFRVVRKAADSLALVQTDSLKKAAARLVSGPYTFNAAAAHNVIMLLDKVDGTYINESKNAFTRYVGDYFRDVQITVTKDAIDKDYALVVFSSFASADEALQFLYKIKKAAPDEVSWLPANKYSFLLIDNDNLLRLKQTKDIPGYKNLLNNQYPGIVK